MVTAEQYLEYDRQSEFKNEYLFGEIISMAGRVPRHSLIAGNAIAALHIRLAKGPCGVYTSDLRVCLNKKTSYVYPDVTVACDPLEFVDGHKDTITNPKLVVEVLSPEDRERGLLEYLKAPSLTDLIFIAQDRVWIEHWHRSGEGGWRSTELEDMAGVLKIESLDCEIPVAQLYLGAELAPGE